MTFKRFWIQEGLLSTSLRISKGINALTSLVKLRHISYEEVTLRVIHESHQRQILDMSNSQRIDSPWARKTFVFVNSLMTALNFSYTLPAVSAWWRERSWSQSHQAFSRPTTSSGLLKQRMSKRKDEGASHLNNCPISLQQLL